MVKANIDDILRDRDTIQKILQKISTTDLADAMAMRKNVMSLTTDGVRVLTISKEFPTYGQSAQA
mgnify:CR=1 FL=1